VTSFSIQTSDSTDHASEVENYGTVGYWHASSYTPVTQEVYAGLPSN
jgi:hypothetical protein